MDRRVVITGMGAVSCVGNSVDTFWDSVTNGRSGITTIDSFDASKFKTQIGGQVRDFDITEFMPAKEARRLDPYSCFAIGAADEAMQDAGLSRDLKEVNPDRVGVVVGSGIGGVASLEKQCGVLKDRGPSKISPFLVPMMIADMASGNLSIRYGAKGINFGIVSACATATHSIGETFWMIKRGDAEIMITGGAEAGITPIAFAGFCSMKAMSQRNDDPKKASRPFDAERDGFVMAEGCGIVILEELEHAKKRGANIYAEVVGYGATGDGYHITAPAPGGEGGIRAINVALQHANLAPEEIDYINAHGTSTPLNDKLETAAFKAVFGEHANDMAISSIKGTIGHNLGAAGALETISCVKSLQNSIIPPTINYENPDPDCDLDYTANTAKEKEIKTALNTNLGFGGHNAVVIMKKFEG